MVASCQFCRSCGARSIFLCGAFGLGADRSLCGDLLVRIRFETRPLCCETILEILAGIPTIVYGLFALTTFGPFLRMFFGDGGFLGVEWMSDSRSVITAGVVMGMMLIRLYPPYQMTSSMRCPIIAGWFIRVGCHAIRNNSQRNFASGPSWYYWCDPVGNIACHW